MIKKLTLTALILFPLFGISHAKPDNQSTDEIAVPPDYVIITDKLKPTKLSADLDGDGKNDKVVYIQHRDSKKYGLCIVLQADSKCIILGAGKKFYAVGDNFRWVDQWEIIEPGKTWQATFRNDGDVLGTEEVRLINRSIRLCVDEGGCGVISYKKGRFIWIHQAD